MKKITAIALGLSIVLSQGYSANAANPTKEEMGKSINETASKIFNEVKAQASKAKETIPSENSFNLAFGTIQLPTGVSVNPTDHSLSDRYNYGIKVFVCSAGVGTTPCTQVAGSNNNASSTNNGGSTINTTPNANGSAEVNPAPVVENVTPIEEPAKPVLPLIFKSLTLKQNASSIITKWSYLKKTPSKLTLRYYDKANSKKVKTIALKGSLKTYEIKGLTIGHTYIVKLSSPSGRDVKTTTIGLLKLPLAPTKVSLYNSSTGLHVSWMEDLTTMMDEKYATVDSAVIIITKLDKSVTTKEVTSPNYSYVFPSILKEDVSKVEVYFKSNAGKSPSKFFRSDVTNNNVVVEQTADGAVKLSWKLEEAPLSQSLTIRSAGNLRDKEVITLLPTDTSIVLTGLTSGGTYSFTTIATHNEGQVITQNSIPLTMLTPPTNVNGLTITGGNKKLLLNWNRNTVSTPSSYSYLIEYKLSTDATYSVLTTSYNDYSVTPYVITDLLNNQSYTVRISALNKFGSSVSSIGYGVPLMIPEAPTGLVVVGGSTYADLQWSNDASGVINSHTVEYRIAGNLTWNTITTNSQLTTYRVTGLSNGYNYEFRVKASSVYGTSVPSTIVTSNVNTNVYAITLLTPSISGSSATVTWQAPAYVLAASSLQGFLVEYQVSGSTLWSSVNTVGLTQSAVVSGLTAGVNYNFRVSAVLSDTSIIKSTLSNAVTISTLSTPGAVSSLVATATSTSANLSWVAPTTTGNGTLSYGVYYKLANALDYTLWSNTATTTAAITGLTVGGSYTFKVVASNGSYSSTPTITTVTIYATASAVVSLTANVNLLTPGSVTLTWMDPTNNGGSFVSGNIVEYKLASASSYTVFNANTALNSQTITGLTGGVLYDFRVTPINGAGNGTAATVQSTPYGVPAAVTSLSSTSDYTTLTLTWVAPSNFGGSAITNYNVYYKIVGTPTYTLAPGVLTLTTYTITGLAVATNYDVKVTASNAVGEGALATTTALTLTPAVPSVIQNLILAPANTQIAISWSAPASSNGATVTSYNVEILDLTTPGATITQVYNGSNLSALATGLTNGNSYQVSVYATNSVGNSSVVASTATPN